MKIEPYESAPAACEPYDPVAVEVAREVAAVIRDRLPDVTVEHVGSTAVPRCAGKGVIDLMVLYGEGQVDQVRKTIDELGFQPQTTREPFPEDRPMRTGSVERAGKRYRIHVHVVARGSQEAQDTLYFRDCLRADPELLAAYVKTKKKIIAAGTTDPVDYAKAKGEFIQQCLGSS